MTGGLFSPPPRSRRMIAGSRGGRNGGRSLPDGVFGLIRRGLASRRQGRRAEPLHWRRACDPDLPSPRTTPRRAHPSSGAPLFCSEVSGRRRPSLQGHGPEECWRLTSKRVATSAPELRGQSMSPHGASQAQQASVTGSGCAEGQARRRRAQRNTPGYVLRFTRPQPHEVPESAVCSSRGHARTEDLARTAAWFRGPATVAKPFRG